jgi:hypothetical protein
VHLGPLGRCHAIELRSRGTCPGSPGYLVRSHPDELPSLPPWLAGIFGHLRTARRGERNRLLFWASLRSGELVTDGDLDARTAIEALTGAATQIGLASEDGPRAVAATIRSGLHRAGAA